MGEKQGEQSKDQPLEGMADPAEDCGFLLEGRGGLKDPPTSMGETPSRTPPWGLVPLQVLPWTSQSGGLHRTARLSLLGVSRPLGGPRSLPGPSSQREHVLQGA